MTYQQAYQKVADAQFRAEVKALQLECAKETWLTIPQVKTLQLRGYWISEIKAWKPVGRQWIPAEIWKLSPNFVKA